MSKLVIRLSALAVCATAVVLVPTVTAAKAKAETSRKHTHITKHKMHWGPHVSSAWQAQPAAKSYTGEVCPGIGRSFDCKIWPPPFADDPDRKTSRF